MLEMKKERSEQLIQETIATYDHVADLFSGTRDYLWNDIKPLSRFLSAGTRVLDIGCGNGRVYHMVTKHQAGYVGVDQSKKLISVAKGKNPDAVFQVADMRDLPFEHESFDCVFAFASFHHLPSNEDRLRALRETRRILRENGKIVMLNWHLQSDWAKEKYAQGDWHKLAGHGSNFSERDILIPWMDAQKNNLGNRYYHSFTFDELTSLASSAGLAIVEQFFTKDGHKSDERKGDNILTVMVR
jgi:ubiquinone/menaquinone biosynthesis C-methylase UbiE